jgi:hypothetical protein
MKTWPVWISRARARLTRVKRGSVLMLTLLMVVGLTYIIGTLLSETVTEMKMNQRGQLTLEAKNAVEAATEYAISIVRQKFDSNPNISGNYFITNPITIPTSISSFLWNGTDVSASNVTVTVGLIPAQTPVYVDPTNPANEWDPARGKNITASDVYVYAQATAANGWGRQTAYGSQAVEVRNAPLFTNAVFYNMDVEFSPGANMTISGPVHCNGNIWAIAEVGLTFTGVLSASGNFNVGLIPYPTNWSTAASDTTDSGNLVYIPAANSTTSSPTYKTPFIGGSSLNQQESSSYWDSRQTNYSNTTYTNWREMSANLWGGNLQTAVNGVPTEQVSSYDNYMFQVNGTITNGTALTDQDLNYAYSIIQPSQPTYYPNGTVNPWNLGTGEAEKFENSASLIIKVLALGTANITQTVVTGSNSTVQAALDSNITATENSFKGLGSSPTPGVLTAAAAAANTSQTINVTVQYQNGTLANFSGGWSNQTSANYSANTSAVMLVTDQQLANAAGKPSLTGGNMETTANITGNSTYGKGTTTRTVGFALVEFDTVQTSLNTTTNTLQPVYNGSTTVTDAEGDVIYPGDVNINPIAVNATQVASFLTFSPGVPVGAVSYNGTGNTSGGNIGSMMGGMYDERRGASVSTLNLDVQALKSYVDNNSSNYTSSTAGWASLFDGTGSTAFNPSNSYNGVLYVQFPELPGNVVREPTDTLTVANSTTGNTTYPEDGVLTSIGGNMGGMNVGLILYNGTSSNVTANSTVTGVPNMNYANTTEGVAGRQSGFTVATNNCVYIDGSYNADGNLNTPETDNTTHQAYNDTMPDSGNINNPDPLCCVAADSVTVLSTNYNFYHSSTENSAANDEINTAIMAGIVPAEKWSSTGQSGGNHNFPRFLENWSGDTFRMRGSMVCLYESEIGDQPWSNNYYSAPSREWGFYQPFANGVYPPGTPNSRSYYRVNFSYITAAAYTTAMSGL